MDNVNDARFAGGHARRLTAQLPVALLACVALISACARTEPPVPAPIPPPTTMADTSSAPALAAYGEFWRMSQLAFAAPGSRDWTSDLGNVASGQALQDLLIEIANYASVPAHVTGTISQSPLLNPAIPPTADRVAVLDCVDISKSTLVSDKNGSVLDDQANQSNRYRYRADVVREPSGRWRVETTSPSLAEQC